MDNKQKYIKRRNSLETYIDALIENNARICPVSVNLKYKEPFSKDVNLDVINKDINNLLNNRRSNKTIFGNNLGYVIKKEFGGDGNLQLRAIFLEDGNSIRNAKYKADQIGKYWSEKITDGKGCYENFNKIKMVDYKNEERVKMLKETVLTYAKDSEEQTIDEIKNKVKERAIVRGTIPKPKSNAGRPRKKI